MPEPEFHSRSEALKHSVSMREKKQQKKAINQPHVMDLGHLAQRSERTLSPWEWCSSVPFGQRVPKRTWQHLCSACHYSDDELATKWSVWHYYSVSAIASLVRLIAIYLKMLWYGIHPPNFQARAVLKIKYIITSEELGSCVGWAPIGGGNF